MKQKNIFTWTEACQGIVRPTQKLSLSSTTQGILGWSKLPRVYLNVECLTWRKVALKPWASISADCVDKPGFFHRCWNTLQHNHGEFLHI